jgi:hypothetical protein
VFDQDSIRVDAQFRLLGDDRVGRFRARGAADAAGGIGVVLPDRGRSSADHVPTRRRGPVTPILSVLGAMMGTCGSR